MTIQSSEKDLGADDVMQRFIRERGDLFEEFHLFAREAPETVNLVRRTAGYVHFYENQTTPDQVLSGPMRELIATCQLCAKNDDRFAPNHVRRLYRMGVTNRVMFEAGEGQVAGSGRPRADRHRRVVRARRGRHSSAAHQTGVRLRADEAPGPRSRVVRSADDR